MAASACHCGARVVALQVDTLQVTYVRGEVVEVAEAVCVGDSDDRACFEGMI